MRLSKPTDDDAIGRCLAGIHQVHGALQMVEFYGAALLAEEIEATGPGAAGRARQPARRKHPSAATGPRPTAAVPRPRTQRPPRSAVGGAAAAQRPAQRPRRKPAVGNQPVQPATAVDLRRCPTKRWPSASRPDLHAQLRKWRQMLQQALAGLLREDHGPSNLEDMARVFARLEALCQGAPLLPLWQVASALVEGMLTGVVANSPALRSLLKASRQATQAPAGPGHRRNQPAGAG